MTTLFKSANVLGLELLGRDHGKLGVVREVFIDLATGRAEFLIVETAGLLGGSGKFHPVPWTSADFDEAKGAFRADLTKDELKASPAYDRDQLNNDGYGWDAQAHKYFAGHGSSDDDAGVRQAGTVDASV